MKNLILICLVFLLFSCEDNYKIVDTEIVKGRVSAIEEGRTGRFSHLPKLYVQDNKKTIEVEIPFANRPDYNVGDTITVIVQQVEIKKK